MTREITAGDATRPLELTASSKEAPTRQKVLFIMGMTRSGSTVVDNVLGEVDGFFSGGEIRLIWKRGVLEHRGCGCGQALLECTVWREVLRRAYGYADRRPIDSQAAVALRTQRSALRIKHTWGLLRRHPSVPPREQLLRAYLAMVAPLYQSIGTVTGARVIIDSSKRPPDAALLRLVPGLDVYVVHLVRDPRAVAYSWRRTRGQPDPNGPVRLATNGTIHSTSRWVYRNAAAEAVMRAVPSDRVLRLRYESFVACPAQTVRSIMRFVGEDGPGPTFSDERTIELGINHTVSGNPSRFRTGSVRIADDGEWRERQRRRHRVVATAVALPLLARYGYALRPDAPGE
jgi:hypothetical protein